MLIVTTSLCPPGQAAAADSFRPFRLKTPDGTLTSLSDVMGKATLVVFFFPTCRFCNLAFPEMQRLHDRYKDRGLAMVWINVIPQQERLVADWQRRRGHAVAVLLGGSSIQNDYALTVTPTHYLLDAEGRVLARHAGYKRGDERKLEEQVRNALISDR